MDEEKISDTIKQVMNMTSGGKDIDLSKIISALGSDNNNSNSNSENNNSSDNSFNIDAETISKIQNIISGSSNSSGNAKKNLLVSLKPFLKTKKQEKINKYIGLLNLSSLAKTFIKSEGSDV